MHCTANATTRGNNPAVLRIAFQRIAARASQQRVLNDIAGIIDTAFPRENNFDHNRLLAELIVLGLMGCDTIENQQAILGNI